MTKQKNPSFEDSLCKLGKSVTQLESGELTLDQAVKTFEQGVKLGNQCQTLLQQAEQQVEILMKDGETLIPFNTEDQTHV